MKKGIAIVLATSLICGLSCYQALGQEQASGAQKTVLKYEGVLTTYDERAIAKDLHKLRSIHTILGQLMAIFSTLNGPCWKIPLS
jgi:hypothetical protein